jgi:hypothetical protein
MILQSHNRQQAVDLVLTAEDGMVLEIRKPKRSLESNRLYWAILSDISEQVVPGKAYEPSVFHEYFKSLFLPEKIIDLPDGSMKLVEASTTELCQKTFSEYIEKVIKWSLENDVKFSEHTQKIKNDNQRHTGI